MSGPLIAASLLAALVIGLPGGALAAIIKCTGADGKVVFSDRPCASGQAATEIKAPTKPAAVAVAKPLTAASLPKEGATVPNSNLHLYDYLCKEDRERLAVATAKATTTISNQNLGYQKDRVDKRCNPEARLAAAEQDVQAQVFECKSSRDRLKDLKSRPKPPPGYGDWSSEIAGIENLLRKNCEPPTR